MYRPNSAKVKNLKTKDYLGKARLVAASDRANAFTGFAGAEMKAVRLPTSSRNAFADRCKIARADIKDDRPSENISYAASNLVKPGLSSKRQQSEPPLNRNVFPPTPPPESSASSNASGTGSMSRGASVRNGPKPMPAKLNIEKAMPPQRYEVREEFSGGQPPRIGTSRTASEPRGPPNRGYSQREGARRQQSRRIPDQIGEDEEYPSELYDMYGSQQQARNSRGSGRRQRYTEEEDDYASDYDDGSFDENDFEMMNSRPQPSRARSSARGQSRRPDIRKVRIKVHAEDVRYIMVGTAVEYPDLVDKIRDKFQLRKRFKIKVKDEDMPNGDMITVGDQDDLEMVMMSVRAQAKRERLEMGKLEVRSLLDLLKP